MADPAGRPPGRPPGGRRTTRRVGGLDLAAWEHGDASAPALLALHGFPVDHRILEAPLEAVLAGRGDRLRVYVDLPGFGASPGATAIRGSDDVLAVVLALVDELAAAGPLLLVGQSWGAYLAAAAAARRPEAVAGLALVCPLVVAAHAERDVPNHAAAVADELAGDPAELAEFREIAVVQDARHWAFYRAAVEPALRAADAAAVARIEAAYALAPTDVAPYAGPTLVVTGRQDAVVGYRDAWPLVEQMPHATFAVLDDAGHHAHVERAPAFAALVGDWLDRVAIVGG